MKILIPVDGSDYSKRMLDFLGAHEEWLNSRNEYTVFHDVLAVPRRAAAMVGAKVVQEFYDDDAEAVLGPVRAFFEQHGITAKYIHEAGHAADAIARIAEEGKFDLIVMGSHGHGEILNLVMGSVVTRVLAKCKVPVLLIR